jgi:hypothetical protein
MFSPPPGTPRHPGVLLLGGAEGGMSQVYAAALLAAHGYPALAVAYFGWPGLPGHLAGVDDALWNSALSAQQVSTDMLVEGSPYQGQAFIYPNAGHGVGTFPYQPIGPQALDALGGTRAGDVAAQRDGWAKVLAESARPGR